MTQIKRVNTLFTSPLWHCDTLFFNGGGIAVHSFGRVRSPKCPSWTVHPWRWCQCNPSKCREPLTQQYSVTFQKTWILVLPLAMKNNQQSVGDIHKIFSHWTLSMFKWSGLQYLRLPLRSCWGCGPSEQHCSGPCSVRVACRGCNRHRRVSKISMSSIITSTQNVIALFTESISTEYHRPTVQEIFGMTPSTSLSSCASSSSSPTFRERSHSSGGSGKGRLSGGTIRTHWPFLRNSQDWTFRYLYDLVHALLFMLPHWAPWKELMYWNVCLSQI